MMDEKAITCELVDQAEMDRRYVEGRLSDAEADAFEEHFFGCDRCWQLVKGGAGVRAALRPGRLAAPAVPSRAGWKPLAIAAGIGIVALGTWGVIASRDAVQPDEIRGAGDSLIVRVGFSAGGWHLAWPAVPEATSYRVRLSAPDGSLLFSREMSDTSLDIAADSLPAPAEGASLYLDVQGFDQLRRPVSRSPLTPLPGPAVSP
jgi:hypothetical protein